MWHYVCMPLTRNFSETVKVRAKRDPAFRQALLAEAIELQIAGDRDVSEALLRDYISSSQRWEER